jgi:glucokinase
VRTVKELLQNPSNTSTLRNISPNELTSKDIYNMAIAGDALANEAFRYTAEVLGLVLADTVTLFSPEAIILFGGLANAGSLLIDPLKNYMENQLMPIYKNKVKIIPSLLPESDAAILGASALAWEISN